MMGYGRKTKVRAARRPKTFSVAAAIWASIVSLIVISVFFIKPVIVVQNHVIVIDDAVLLGAIIVGSAFWGIAEALTKPGTEFRHLFLRVFIAFTAGLFVGGFATLVFNFGQYLIIPAYYGNPWADFEAFAIGTFTIVTVWHAAWLHTRSYRFRVR